MKYINIIKIISGIILFILCLFIYKYFYFHQSVYLQKTSVGFLDKKIIEYDIHTNIQGLYLENIIDYTDKIKENIEDKTANTVAENKIIELLRHKEVTDFNEMFEEYSNISELYLYLSWLILVDYDGRVLPRYASYWLDKISNKTPAYYYLYATIYEDIDINLSIEYYNKSLILSEQYNNSDIQYRLGLILEEGGGINKIKSISLFFKSMLKGHEDGKIKFFSYIEYAVFLLLIFSTFIMSIYIYIDANKQLIKIQFLDKDRSKLNKIKDLIYRSDELLNISGLTCVISNNELISEFKCSKILSEDIFIKSLVSFMNENLEGDLGVETDYVTGLNKLLFIDRDDDMELNKVHKNLK